MLVPAANFRAVIDAYLARCAAGGFAQTAALQELDPEQEREGEEEHGQSSRTVQQAARDARALAEAVSRAKAANALTHMEAPLLRRLAAALAAPMHAAEDASLPADADEVCWNPNPLVGIQNFDSQLGAALVFYACSKACLLLPVAVEKHRTPEHRYRIPIASLQSMRCSSVKRS